MNTNYSKIDDISIVMKYLALDKSNTVKSRICMGIDGLIYSYYRINEYLEIEKVIAQENENIEEKEWEIINLPMYYWYDIVDTLKKEEIKDENNRTLFDEIRTIVENAESKLKGEN